MTSHTVTFERVVTERAVKTLDWPDDGLTTVHAEVYANTVGDIAVEKEGGERIVTPWRVVDASPPIQTATITVKGGPTGKRIRSPRRCSPEKEVMPNNPEDPNDRRSGLHTTTAPVSDSAGAGPSALSKAGDAGPIPGFLDRTKRPAA